MAKVDTMSINRGGKRVVINRADFNPNRDKRWSGGGKGSPVEKDEKLSASEEKSPPQPVEEPVVEEPVVEEPVVEEPVVEESEEDSSKPKRKKRNV